jgi:hypothetical protein
MYKDRAVAGWKSWQRVIPVQLAPLFFLLFTSFAFNCTPTPALAAPAAIAMDYDGGEDSDPIGPPSLGETRAYDADDLDPYALGLRDAYLDHVRFCGGAGASVPQIDDFGYPRGFEARGPPLA